jgi:hypothetical protein
MRNILANTVLPEIDELIMKYEEMQEHSQYDDLSDIARDDASAFVVAGMAAIHRAAGKDSQFAIQTAAAIDKIRSDQIFFKMPHVAGALKALQRAIVAGYLVSVQELIQATVFADFLEMAEHLLGEGYKDPAAVLIGGVLEEHIRGLCIKSSIPIEIADARGMRPKKADAMNADLAAANAYNKLDQKSITSWLDLRNKAAHGHYTEYTKPQVELLLQAVRDFLTRHPA